MLSPMFGGKLSAAIYALILGPIDCVGWSHLSNRDLFINLLDRLVLHLLLQLRAIRSRLA